MATIGSPIGPVTMTIDVHRSHDGGATWAVEERATVVTLTAGERPVAVREAGDAMFHEAWLHGTRVGDESDWASENELTARFRALGYARPWSSARAIVRRSVGLRAQRERGDP